MFSGINGGYSGYQAYQNYGGYNYNSPVQYSSIGQPYYFGGNQSRNFFNNAFSANPFATGMNDFGGAMGGMQQIFKMIMMLLMSRLGSENNPITLPEPDNSNSTTKVESEQKKPMTTDPYTGGKAGKIWGDPHFVGFDGETYDVQGEAGKTYNLLSDKNFQMNGEFKSWNNSSANVIDKLGFKVGSSKVELDANGTTGPKVTTMENGVAKETVLADGQTVALDKGGSATWKDGKLTVTSDEYTTTATVQKVENVGNYIDLDTNINENGPNADGISSHGLLGQTADNVAGGKDTGTDQGAQGGRAIDGTVTDYEESGLFSDDSKYSRFDSNVKVDSRGMDDTTDITYDKDGKVLYKKAVDPAYTNAAKTFVAENASQDDKSYVSIGDFVGAATQQDAWADGKTSDAKTFFGFADRNHDGKLTADEYAIALAESDANADKSTSAEEMSGYVQQIQDWRYNQ